VTGCDIRGHAPFKRHEIENGRFLLTTDWALISVLIFIKNLILS
jgi:hypothetical protein